MKNHKPRILLIPDVGWWVIGEMGKQIIARFHQKYEFYLLPMTILGRRPDLLETMLPAVDAIHCISYETIELFSGCDSQTMPPIATWIHHVTTWNPVQQAAVDKSSAVTTCTQCWKEYLNARVAGRIPVIVVPHGVDTEFFRHREVRPSCFGIPPGHFVLGFVGNKGSDLDYGRKGTDVLLDVVRKAAACLPNLHVVMGGPGWESEIADLRALGISVSSTGYIRRVDLPALYSALDVYLLTSRVEGGPCTVFEAMACGTAVVLTRVGAVSDLIVNGVNGYSAEVDDREALIAAVVELGQSPDRRIAVGKAARSTVSARSWSATLSPLEAVYDELIQQRRREGLPKTRPSFMRNSDRLTRASCAADALLTVYTRIRHHSITIIEGIRMVREMLNGQSVIDIVRGAAMIRRLKPVQMPDGRE